MAGKIIGEIFSKEKAIEEFGDVQKSVAVKSEELQHFLSLAQEYVMFNIETDIFKVLDEKRNSIKGIAKSDNEVFYRFSTSLVKKILEDGKSGTTYIEMRPKTLTITNGNSTLEMGIPCPPYCD